MAFSHALFTEDDKTFWDRRRIKTKLIGEEMLQVKNVRRETIC